MTYRRIAQLLGLAFTCTLIAVPPAGAASGVAPGAPGAPALWTSGDKDGFGTSTTPASTVWHTLGGGELTEVYYPDLGTPAVRDLQFVVSDGKSWVDREREDTRHSLSLTDPRSLSYRQVNTDPDGRYRITKTYTTDPRRSVLLIRVHFESLTRKPLRLYALYDPSLSGNGDDDSGSTAGTALVASDAKAASALVAAPAFTKTSSGYLGSSDGWSDLHADDTMDFNYTSAPNGQRRADRPPGADRQGRKPGRDAGPRLRTLGARGAFRRHRLARRRRLWQPPRGRTGPGGTTISPGCSRPRSVAGHKELYDVSLMVLAASEDKTYRGAGIASPTMAWVWGQLPGYNGPYHLVWSRDLYEMATAQIAAGDRAAAGRGARLPVDAPAAARRLPAAELEPRRLSALGRPPARRGRRPDPARLAARTHRRRYLEPRRSAPRSASSRRDRPPRSAGRTRPGYSPASIGAEIAGLVCAAQIAQANGASEDGGPVPLDR